MWAPRVKLIIWRPVKANNLAPLQNRYSLIFFRARAQMADNFWRNYFPYTPKSTSAMFPIIPATPTRYSTVFVAIISKKYPLNYSLIYYTPLTILWTVPVAAPLPRAVFSSAARVALVQVDIFPRAHDAISAALL